MKRLRLVAAGDDAAEPSAAEQAAIAALTQAMGRGLQRGVVIFEDAEGAVMWEYIATGPATMRGLIDMAYEALHPDAE